MRYTIIFFLLSISSCLIPKLTIPLEYGVFYILLYFYYKIINYRKNLKICYLHLIKYLNIFLSLQEAHLAIRIKGNKEGFFDLWVLGGFRKMKYLNIENSSLAIITSTYLLVVLPIL